jgi:hypothetical protein
MYRSYWLGLKPYVKGSPPQRCEPSHSSNQVWIEALAEQYFLEAVCLRYLTDCLHRHLRLMVL